MAVAESLTGGLLGAAITEVAGASGAFRGGITAYATDLKASLLGVDPDLLAEQGPVCPEVAAAMAEGVRRKLMAGYGLSTTGVAGPTPQGGREPGTVYVAFAGPDAARVHGFFFLGDRRMIRKQAVTSALALALESLDTGSSQSSQP